MTKTVAEYEAQLTAIAGNAQFAQLEGALNQFHHNITTGNFDKPSNQRTSASDVDLDAKEIKELAEMLASGTSDKRTKTVAAALDNVTRLQTLSPAELKEEIRQSSLKEDPIANDIWYNGSSMSDEAKIGQLAASQIRSIPFKNSESSPSLRWGKL